MTNFLLMNIVALATSLLLLVALGFYFLQFKKLEKKKYKISWIFTSVVVVVLLISFVLSLVGLVLSSLNYDNQPTSALVLWIVSFVFIILTIITIFVFIQYFAIALTSDSINFLGERILYSNIKAIIQDEKSQNICVFHKQGKRVTKKTRINKKMVASDFFDESITGFKIEIKDVHAYADQIANTN